MTKPTHNTGLRPRRISTADVRASFNPAGGKEPMFMAYVCRPLSHYCTVPFYNSGWSADALTYLRFIIGLVALACFTIGHPLAYIAAAFLYYVHHIFDCVDGNLARLTNSATYWGKFIDGLVDVQLTTFIPIATGVGLWLYDGYEMYMFLGALVTSLALFTHLTRNRMSFFREWMISQSEALTGVEQAKFGISPRLDSIAVSISFNARFLAPLCLVFSDGGQYYIILLAVIHVTCDTISLATLIHMAHVMLSRPRTSRHAAATNSD